MFPGGFFFGVPVPLDLVELCNGAARPVLGFFQNLNRVFFIGQVLA
jgi:hypothetical protein